MGGGLGVAGAHLCMICVYFEEGLWGFLAGDAVHTDWTITAVVNYTCFALQ